jgi:hypothetical protein
MKTQIKLLIMSILIVTGVVVTATTMHAQTTATGLSTAIDPVIGTPIKYQNDDIRVDFVIYVDNKLIHANNYDFEFICKELGVNVKEVMPSEFTAYLKYDKQYQFRFSGEDYNCKIVDISTIAPKNRWEMKLNIYLYSKEYSKKILKEKWVQEEYAGKMAYNDSSKTFKKY